jgi:hypothetical protein
MAMARGDSPHYAAEMPGSVCGCSDLRRCRLLLEVARASRLGLGGSGGRGGRGRGVGAVGGSAVGNKLRDGGTGEDICGLGVEDIRIEDAGVLVGVSTGEGDELRRSWGTLLIAADGELGAGGVEFGTADGGCEM